VTSGNENLRNLLVAGLSNLRPPIIEPDLTPPVTTAGTSPTDELVGLLTSAVNQDVESDNAPALTAWEDCNRKLAAAINEAIQQEEPRTE
jgi:hypothetical protein